MRTFFALVLTVLLASSLGWGTIAHASEGPRCIEASSTEALEHASGDGDQVPSDSDKDFPHHHNSCHGHHIGVTVTSDVSHAVIMSGKSLIQVEQDHLASASPDTALRPPQA